MSDPARRRVTYAEYLELERARGMKHEFLDGDVLAMAGGTIAHGVLSFRMSSALARGLGEGPCLGGSSDLKVYIEARNRATYADAVVFCGPPARAPHDHNAITNPTVIVEVLSDETEADDRGEKFDAYATLTSLKEYVLVDQHEPRIEVFRRAEAGAWTFTRHALGDTVRLPSIDARFSVDEIYAGLTLEPKKRGPRLASP